MALLASIMDQMRVVVAATPTTRDATVNFLEHTTNQPFDDTPASEADGFEVVERKYHITQGFGIYKSKEWEAHLFLRIGHFPAGTDRVRDDYLAGDIQRLSDILESATWPNGTSAVWYEGSETNKKNPNWWLSELDFRVMGVESIES